MKNSIENQVAEAVADNVVDYFANLITSYYLVDEHIRPIIPVSDEQEENICAILAQHDIDWNTADCDADGPTQEQDEELDKIIKQCAEEIAKLLCNQTA